MHMLLKFLPRGDVNQHLLLLPSSQQIQEQFQVHSWGTKHFTGLRGT